MKNFICKSNPKSRSVFLCLLALSAALLGTSCKNFLNANEVKNEIEEAIEYNNAKEITFQIDSEGMGLVSLNGSITKKIGYEFEIQFKPDTDNYVLKDPSSIFEALNYYDRTKNYDEYITYTPIEQTVEDKSYGIYRQKIKINQDITGLYFRPKCLALPVIESKTPDYSPVGVYANNSVTVTFSMPMEALDTPAEESQFNYTNIIVMYKNQDISDCFETPVFNEDKTVLTIAPIAKKIQAFMDEAGLSLMDVQFSFSSNISTKIDDVELPFKQNENSKFTICYNPDFESTPPLKKAFYITRSAITLDDAESLAGSEKFVQKLVANFSDTDVLQNRANARIYVYGQYIDAESGVKEVVIKERRTNEMESTNPVEEETIVHTFNKNNSQFKTDDRGNTWFVIECPLESEDGAVLVNVIVKDNCGNESAEENMSVINKTKVLCDSYYLGIENIPLNKLNQVFLSTSFDYDYFVNNLKNIKIYTSDDYIENDPDNVYTQGVTDILYGKKVRTKDYSVYAEYKPKDDSIRIDKFSIYSREPFIFEGSTDYFTKGWSLDLDIDRIKGNVCKIIIEDDIGARFEKEFSLPADYRVVYKYDSDSNLRLETKPISEEGILPSLLPLIIYKQDDIYKWTLNTVPSGITNCQIIPVEISYGSKFNFCGDISEEINCITQAQYQANIPDKIEIKSAEWKKCDDIGYVTLKINFDENWSDYDLFYVRVKKLNNDRNENYHELVFPAAASLDVNVSLSYAFIDYADEATNSYTDEKKNIRVQIKGYKGNYESDYFIYPFPKYSFYRALDPVEGAEVQNKIKEIDNFPPKVECRLSSGRDAYKFTIYDAGFPYSSAILTVNNGKTFTIPIGSNASCVVDKWDLDIIDGVNMKVGTYVAKDAFGVEYTGDVYLETSNKNTFTKIEKNSNNQYILSMDPATQESNMSNYLIAVMRWNETTNEWEEYFPEEINHPETTDPKHGDHMRVYVENIQTEDGWVCRTRNNPSASYYSAISLPQDSFLCIQEKTYSKDYVYFYTAPSSSGNYDYIFSENSDNAVFVSDEKVYVQTLYVNRDYDVCSTWTAREWERYAQKTGEKVMTFSSSDYVPKKYTFPSNIPDGACYVAVFHTANGSNTKAIKTKVYRK